MYFKAVNGKILERLRENKLILIKLGMFDSSCLKNYIWGGPWGGPMHPAKAGIF